MYWETIEIVTNIAENINENNHFEFSSGLLMSVSVYFVVVVRPSVETFSNYDFELSKKVLTCNFWYLKNVLSPVKWLMQCSKILIII